MGRFPVSGPYTISTPEMVSADGFRVGAGVLSPTVLWLHRPGSQRVTVDPALLAGVPVRSGVVAVLSTPGGNTVTSLAPSAGVISGVIVDDVGIECGVVAWSERVVD